MKGFEKNLVKNIKIFPKKKKYGREQYKNLPENENKPVDYRKRYYERLKNKN